LVRGGAAGALQLVEFCGGTCGSRG
jgi:hypothetical protein